MKRYAKSIILLMVLLSWVGFTWAKEPIRVLAIGNSFSVDAVEQNLWELAREAQTDLVIGNCYHAGCSIQRHVRNLKENVAEYEYRKIGTDGVLTNLLDATLEKMLADEPWDYVTVQQVSGYSGLYESYHPYMEELLSYVKARVPEKCKILFHQTWAYQQGGNHPDFHRYDNDQLTMYRAIMQTSRKVMKEMGIKTVIPSGTAVQNARGTWMGDTLNRDGYHMDYHFGRYLIACVWFEVLTGKSVVGNAFLPEGVSVEQQKTLQKAAHAAVRKPWKVSEF